jgi:hypothetical protein
MSRWIIATTVLALTLGCAGGGSRWERPGTSPEQTARDQNDCMNKATLAGDPGSLDPNERASVEKDYQNCLLRKGYKLTVPDK